MANSPTAAGTHLAAIFGRVWDGATPLPPAIARHVLTLGFSAADLDRMRQLTTRNRDGTLTASEEAELDDYLRAGDLLAVLQSKARMRLGRKVRGGHG